MQILRVAVRPKSQRHTIENALIPSRRCPERLLQQMSEFMAAHDELPLGTAGRMLWK